ncbi:MAG: homoserine dehydrogenase [Actinomycetota bacterium]|nr:homoserine dehydrogenase [Actinomycetota bacterium]
MSSSIRVGLLGCGVVGGATARILLEHADYVSQKAGVRVDLARIAVRSLSKPREVSLPPETYTTDPWEVVGDPSIDVIVEAMGGIEPALDLILHAIRSGKDVVTANKELLSTLGREVMFAADEAGVDVLFEASVAGGIPIVRPMKESLAGDRVKRVMGIVNGTTNFILTQMSETGSSFSEALGQAEELGYTELDPSADIEGFDAAAKIAILASLAFGARVVAGDVHREGISKVTAADVDAAHQLGYEVKLLAVAEIKDGQVSARVHPAMLPRTHPLASVRDVYNAVFVEGEEVGELMFLGRGAGGPPTASAVVGDIVELARNIKSDSRSPGSAYYQEPAHIRPQDEVDVRYYIVLSVQDQPGVLSSVAGMFAHHGISIASVRQEGFGDQATLVLITHHATEAQHAATFGDLEQLDAVKSVGSRMRVEGTSES